MSLRKDPLGETIPSSVSSMSAPASADGNPRRITMTHDDENSAHDAAMTEALDWFTRRQSGTMTPGEAHTFDAWRAAHPANARAYERVAGLWASPEFAHALEIQAPATPSRPARRRTALRPALALAAALVLAVGLSHLLDGNPFQSPADHTTETGQHTEVPLADGSVVVLNAESAVNILFDAGKRRVELVRGEAFFDVRPDAGRPFEVAAGRSLTRVVGTAFSVTLQGGDTEIRVQRGHVRVTGDDGGAPVDLTPGEGVTVTAGRAGGAARAPQTAFAWLDGRFVFHDRPLAEVMARLARHHKDRVVLATARLRRLRVSGNYRLDDPAAVVAALADVAGADVIRVPGLLTVLH